MAFLFKKKLPLPKQDINTNIQLAQHGHIAVREDLIKEYTPFILKVVSKFCGRYIRIENDDEYSIGLMAFNEAIDKYDFNQGTTFFTFAEMVIKNRVIDYFRTENKHQKSVPWSSMNNSSEEDEPPMEIATWQEAKLKYQDREDSWVKKQEILEYQKKLQDFNITFKELLEICPKHQDARDRAKEVAKIIAGTTIYSNYLLEKKTLPLKLLTEKVDFSRKTLERQRKYIIALTLVYLGDYSHLISFLDHE